MKENVVKGNFYCINPKHDSVCVHVCVPLFFERAGRRLKHSHGDVDAPKCISTLSQPDLNSQKGEERVFPLPFPPSLGVIGILPACCSALSLGFTAVFPALLWRPDWAQPATVITAECRLLWRRLLAVTGFGRVACRGNMRTSRRVVTRQRVKHCDSFTQFTHLRDR